MAEASKILVTKKQVKNALDLGDTETNLKKIKLLSYFID